MSATLDITGLNAQQRALIEALVGSFAGDAPAKQTKATRKPSPKKAPSGKAKSEWNRSFAALCKARKGCYREAMDQWADVTAMRDAGKTPRQARKALFGF